MRLWNLHARCSFGSRNGIDDKKNMSRTIRFRTLVDNNIESDKYCVTLWHFVNCAHSATAKSWIKEKNLGGAAPMSYQFSVAEQQSNGFGFGYVCLMFWWHRAIEYDIKSEQNLWKLIYFVFFYSYELEFHT